MTLSTNALPGFDNIVNAMVSPLTKLPIDPKVYRQLNVLFKL